MLSRKAETIKDSAGIAMPGVASFGYAISQLGKLAELIKKLALGGSALLGICADYQMFFDRSNEYDPNRVSQFHVVYPKSFPVCSLKNTI